MAIQSDIPAREGIATWIPFCGVQQLSNNPERCRHAWIRGHSVLNFKETRGDFILHDKPSGSVSCTIWRANVQLWSNTKTSETFTSLNWQIVLPESNFGIFESVSILSVTLIKIQNWQPMTPCRSGRIRRKREMLLTTSQLQSQSKPQFQGDT